MKVQRPIRKLYCSSNEKTQYLDPMCFQWGWRKSKQIQEMLKRYLGDQIYWSWWLTGWEREGGRSQASVSGLSSCVDGSAITASLPLCLCKSAHTHHNILESITCPCLLQRAVSWKETMSLFFVFLEPRSLGGEWAAVNVYGLSFFFFFFE